MFPDQQDQNNGRPQYGPGAAPQPTYGVNSAPQQAPNGQYQVVPPPSVTGHPTGHNPYEFIVNPGAPKARLNLFGGGNSFLKRIAVIVGGAVLLMVVVGVVVSLLAPKSNAAGLTSIAERQQEIVRVATAVSLQAHGQDTKNFALNTEYGVLSSQGQVIKYLDAHGTGLDPKKLTADQSDQTDTLLKNAAAANTYDTTAVQNLVSQLQTYQGLLQTTFNQAANQEVKQLLQSCFSSTKLLIEQAKNIH